ncbi:PAS domain S-box protein [Pedobacter fastidiosus]
MDTMSTTNDLPGMQLISKMLDTIGFPALLLKVEGGAVTIELINRQFRGMAKEWRLLKRVVSLRKFYASEENYRIVLAGIIFAAKNESMFSRDMNLETEVRLGTNLRYCVENTFLLAEGKIAYVQHVLKPVENKTKVKSSLSDCDTLKTHILENTDESFILLDRKFNIVDFSRRSKYLIGKYFNFELEKGRPILGYALKEERSAVLGRYKRVLDGETQYSEMEILAGKNLTEKISIVYKPLMGESGQVEGIFISATNIAEKTAMQLALDSQALELSLIYNHLSETVFLVSVEDNKRFRFTSVNWAFLENTGLAMEEVIGHYLEEVIPEPYLQAALAQYRLAIKTKESVSREETAAYPSGKRVSVITLTPYCDSSGRCTKIIGSIQDITARVLIEREQKETLEKMERILDSSPDVICTIDGQGFFRGASAAARRIWGYAPEFLKEKQVADFVDIKDLGNTATFLQKVLLGENTTSFENGMIHKDGSVVPMIWSANWNPSEKLIYCTVREASEKMMTEKLLVQSEKRFRALVHDGSDMIAILDDTANYLYVSPSSKSVLDFEPEIFIGRNAFEFIHPEDIERANKEFATVAGQRKVSLSPFRFLHNNGSWRWVQTVITDLRDAPAVRGYVSNSRDVTEMVEAQKDIEISHERYRYVGKATSDAVWDWDIASGSVFWGEGFLKLFGYSEDTLNSDIHIWNRRIHALDVDRVQQKLEGFLASGEANLRDDYRFLKADGTYAHVVDKGFVIRDSKGMPLRMIGALQDITLRKKEEARLRILESVVTNTIDAVLVAEIWPTGEFTTRIIVVNSAFEQLTGYSASEVEGRSPWFLQGSGSDRSELRRLIDSIGNNKPYKGTIVNYRKDGGQIWVSYSVTPVADQIGNYTHWVAILRDVSEQKKQEHKQLLLADITNIFNRDKGLKETVSAVVGIIADFSRAGFAALWTVHPMSSMLDLEAYYIVDDPTRNTAGDALSLDFGRQYALQIQNNVKEGFWKISEQRETRNAAGIKSVHGFPLHHHRTLIGVLLIGTMKPADPKQQILPDLLGKHLGTELHRKKLEQDLNHIFRLAPDIISITDFAGNFKKLNPAASRILGYSMEELLSRPFSDFLHPDEREETIVLLHGLRKSGKSYYIEEHYTTSDGRSKWLAWTSQPLEDEQLVYSVAKDITEKKELEELLLSTNSLARIGSWELSFPERIITWSAITREILNAKMDYVPDAECPLGEFYPQAAMEMMEDRIWTCIQTGIPWDEVLQVRKVSGELKWVRSIGGAERIQGKCLRLFGSLQDIDLQKHAEISASDARADLEESERRYSALFHLSPLPMWVYDFETLEFLDVNQTALSHYGYTKEEFLSMTIRQIRPAEDIRLLEKTIKKTRKQDNTIFQGTFEHIKKNGEIIQVEVKSNTIIFKGTKAKVIIASDITERLRHFAAIETRNERLREVAWIQSHKVRAPLARLMGLVNMITEKQRSEPEVKRILNYICSSADELDQVIREIVIRSEELDKPDL